MSSSTLPLGECCICLETDATLHLVRICGQHYACKPHLREMFERAMRSETAYPPSCCDGALHLSPDDFIKYLGPDLCLQYRAKEAEYAQPPWQRLYCAKKSCGAFIPDFAYTKDGKSACIKCDTLICRRCKKTVLIGTHVCIGPPEGELNQEVTAAEDRNILTFAANEGYKRCPCCGILIELKDACNHMTCNYCRAEFCFICLRPHPCFNECQEYREPGVDEEGYYKDSGFHRFTGLNRTGHNRSGTKGILPWPRRHRVSSHPPPPPPPLPNPPPPAPDNFANLSEFHQTVYQREVGLQMDAGIRWAEAQPVATQRADEVTMAAFRDRSSRADADREAAGEDNDEHTPSTRERLPREFSHAHWQQIPDFISPFGRRTQIDRIILNSRVGERQDFGFPLFRDEGEIREPAVPRFFRGTPGPFVHERESPWASEHDVHRDIRASPIPEETESSAEAEPQIRPFTNPDILPPQPDLTGAPDLDSFMEGFLQVPSPRYQLQDSVTENRLRHWRDRFPDLFAHSHARTQTRRPGGQRSGRRHHFRSQPRTTTAQTPAAQTTAAQTTAARNTAARNTVAQTMEPLRLSTAPGRSSWNDGPELPPLRAHSPFPPFESWTMGDEEMLEAEQREWMAD